MAEASTSVDMSPGLLRVAERARREPEGRFHSLAHLIDVPALRRAYARSRKDAAVGVDGMTKERYGQDLDVRLEDLHERLRTRLGYRRSRTNWSRTSSARFWSRFTSRTSWTVRTDSGLGVAPTTPFEPWIG
jgi:hypothetical protein